jgi:parallel beta-helix repeat protein
MLRKLSFFLPAAILLLAAGAPLRSHAQQTIIVNGNPPPPNFPYPYKTIQSGIDAASNGDTVEVVAIIGGAYAENISFKGKAITVTGIPFAGAMPIIQGANAEPAVVFQSGETSSSVLSNFIIQNGGGGQEPGYPAPPGPYSLLSGAIYVSGASPTILNNTLSNAVNEGILVLNGAAPSILNNNLSQSECYGIYVQDAAPLIQGNTISGTIALVQGVSLCNQFGGSAIRILNGATAFTRVIGNTIENNVQSGTYSAPGYVPTGPGGGAGISVNAPAIIQNNIIRNNNSNAAWGGGIDIEGGSIFVVQNLIYGNNSNCGGGAIALPAESPNYDVTVLISNNTIVDNTNGADNIQTCAPAAQIFAANVNISEDLGASHVVIVDNILSGDTNYIDVDCAQVDPPNEAYQSIFDHNILYNAGGNFFGQYCVDVSAKYGNLAVNPQLKSPSAGDYSLAPGSPAIDVGNTSAIQLIQQLSGIDLTTDFTGITPRVLDATPHTAYPVIDIGAYEYNPNGVTQAPPLPTTMVLSFTFPTDYHYVLTATTKSPAGVPVGPVSFFVDGVPLVSTTTKSSSAEIDASGIATLTDFPLNAGTHALTATYPGHDGFTPAIAVVNIVAIPFIPTHLLIDDDVHNRAPFGTPVTFTVTPTADDGTVPAPITLTDVSDGTLLATLPSGVTTFATVAPSPIGSHPIQAKYAGNLIYAPSADTDPFESTGADTSITLTCGPLEVPVGTPVPLVATVTSADPKNGSPTGTVDFKQNFTDLSTATLMSGVATKPNVITVPGQNTFTATYPSQPGFASSVSNACYVYSPALAITSSAPNGAPAYTPITFTATLAGTTIPAGKYSLTISTNPVTTAPMAPNAAGSSATYTTSILAPGTYDVTATFAPNAGSTPYTASLYPPQLVTAPIGDFTFTGPSTLSARTENTAKGTLTLTSIDSFSGTVALTCNLPLPSTYTCTINPTNIPLAVNATAVATLTLAPTNLRAANTPRPGTSRIVFAMLVPFTLLSLAGLRRRRANFRRLICLSVLTIVAASTTACGHDIFYTATKPGPYPFTITATGTTKGGTTPSTHTLNVTLDLAP